MVVREEAPKTFGVGVGSPSFEVVASILGLPKMVAWTECGDDFETGADCDFCAIGAADGEPLDGSSAETVLFDKVLRPLLGCGVGLSMACLTARETSGE